MCILSNWAHIHTGGNRFLMDIFFWNCGLSLTRVQFSCVRISFLLQLLNAKHVEYCWICCYFTCNLYRIMFWNSIYIQLFTKHLIILNLQWFWKYNYDKSLIKQIHIINSNHWFIYAVHSVWSIITTKCKNTKLENACFTSWENPIRRGGIMRSLSWLNRTLIYDNSPNLHFL